MFMMLTRRAAGTPLKILMFLKTLSAGAFSRPAMERSTIAAPLSRRAEVRLSRTRRAESVSGTRWICAEPTGICGDCVTDTAVPFVFGDGLFVVVAGAVAQA